MRPCECKGDIEELEIACVMDGCWCVRCNNCGALTYHGDTKEAAVKLWDENRLQRAWGYKFNPQRNIDIINMGKQIAGLDLLPNSGVAEVTNEREC